MNDESLMDGMRYCRQLRSKLAELWPLLDWEVCPKDWVNSITFASQDEGIPSSVIASVKLFAPNEPGKVYRVVAIEIPGKELSQCKEDGDVKLVLGKYCGQLAAWSQSPTALKPAPKINFVGKIFGVEVASDSPVCLFNTKTNQPLECFSETGALATYFLLGNSPDVDVNDLHILQWHGDKWAIINPESIQEQIARRKKPS